ncbi:MAG TPA: TonB-dependent receptor [Longimicrobiales bacterium]|nr:TonB-dependent receptor [Longimicrobiales bacterium]
MIRRPGILRGWGVVVALAAAAPASALQVGRVVEADSGAPVPGAEVTWRGEGVAPDPVSVATGADGRFAVPATWRAVGRVEVAALGYAPFTATMDEARARDWELRLAADPLHLEDVVVTVAGRSQARSEVALPVQRISAGEIEASGAESAQRLLAEIPGLQSTPGTPTGSNIMIRGIGDSRVLVLIDGQPAGGALIENRDLSRLSLAGVEGVEVVKGPLSSLYGSDALGGVINVITKAPERGFRVDARFLQGTQGRQEADATVSGGGAVAYRVTGSWRQQDQVPGLAPGEDAFSRVWDLRSTVRYGEAGSLQLRGDATVLRERQRWPVGGGFSGFNDNVGITAWGEARYPALGGTVFGRVLGQDYSHLYRSARGDAPIEGGDEDRQDERLWKGTAGWSATLGSHGLDLGIEYARREIASPDKILEDRASDTQFEAFAQDAWRLGGTTLSAGVRGTFNDRWGDAFSPTVGVSSLLTDELRLRASVGRGFRSPSFKELAWDFANLGAGYVVQGFADLSPERSWNVSGGVEWAPSARLTLDLEVYDNDIENLIEFAFVGNTPSGLLIYSPRNVARARTRGLETGFEWRAGRWRLDGSYAFLDALSLETDLPLDRRARHSGRIRVGSVFDVLHGLTVDLDGHVTGDAPLIGTDETGLPAEVGTQAALYALDAHVGLEVRSGIRVVLGVDNLFDHQPEGWQGLVGRRFRMGLEATDLF